MKGGSNVYYQIRTYTKEYGWFREQRRCKTLEAAKSEALQFVGKLELVGKEAQIIKVTEEVVAC